jgi:hypothetical protein
MRTEESCFTGNRTRHSSQRSVTALLILSATEVVTIVCPLAFGCLDEEVSYYQFPLLEFLKLISVNVSRSNSVAVTSGEK